MQDTLNEISLSEGELIPKSDPLLKILQTIRSPVEVRGVNAGGVSPRQREEPKSRSEGEISIGEQRRMIESMVKPGAAGGM